MNGKSNKLIGTVIGGTLLAVGVAGALYFLKTKPQASRRTMSAMIPVVETMALPVGELALTIDCLGTVIADRTADLQAEVSGRVVMVNPALLEGARVRQGDVLLEIEAADYRLALQTAEANLLTATSTLRIEQGQQDVVRHELELMGSSTTNGYRDLLLREPQLKVAEAAVQRAQIDVELARLHLERTKIVAPFDAVVLAADVDAGDYAQSGKTLVELAATDRYFVRASVPLSSLDPLPDLGVEPYVAVVTLSDGTTRPAKTSKLLPDLTDKGRMARILLAVDDPFDGASGRPLLLNEFVRVEIMGETVKEASLIPRSVLHDGDTVWMLDAGNHLRILPVEVLQGYVEEVLVRVDAEPGMQLITTDLSAPVNGMELHIAGAASQTAKESGRPQKETGK